MRMTYPNIYISTVYDPYCWSLTYTVSGINHNDNLHLHTRYYEKSSEESKIGSLLVEIGTGNHIK